MATRSQLVIKRHQLHTSLFIIMLCLSTIAQILASSNITTVLFFSKSWFYSIVPKATLYVLFGVFMISGRYGKSKLYIMMALSIIVVAITLNTQNQGFAIMYMTFLAYPPELEIRTLAKWESRCFLGVTAIVLAMYFGGLIIADTSIRGLVTRNSCGFVSPNAFGNTVLLWIITYICYKRNHWRWKNTVLCGAFVIWVYYQTNSRMSFLISIVLIAIMQAWSIRGERDIKAVFTLASYSFPVFSAFCLLITYIYEKGYFQAQLTTLNIFISYRLGFMRNYFNDYGLKPFGQIIETVSRSEQLETGKAWSGLDNSYMYIMICWGMVITLIFGVLYYMLGKYLKKQNDIYGALCVVALCVVGLTESYLSITGYNIVALMIAQMISSRKSEFHNGKNWKNTGGDMYEDLNENVQRN